MLFAMIGWLVFEELDPSDLSDGQEHLGLGWYVKNSIKYMNIS